MELFQQEYYLHLILELLLMVLLLIKQIVTESIKCKMEHRVDLVQKHQLHIMMAKQIMDIVLQ